MAIIYIGALRFAGLAADVPSLPLDATLLGAIFDATDTLEKWIFDGVGWKEFVAGNPITTKGDLFTFDTDDARLPVGNADQLLSVDVAEPTGLKWIDPPVSSPLTTKGDVYSFSTFDERLPVGNNGQVLSSDSLEVIGLKWIDPVSSPLTTKGDLFAFSTVDVRFPVGADGQVLSADAAEVTGLKWVAQSGGAGSGITGLNPNSTILDYSTDITEYTTPSSATATSPSGGQFDNGISGGASGGKLGFVWSLPSSGTGIVVGQTISAVGVEVTNASGNIRLGAYDDVGGVPTNLLSESASVLAVGGTQILSVTPFVVPANGIVWFAFQNDDNSCTVEALSSAGSARLIAHSYGAFPDPYGSTSATNDRIKFYWVVGENLASDAIDGNTTTFWQSDAGINEAITLDMGSEVNMYGLAYFISTAELATMTETQFQIKTEQPAGMIATGGTITQVGDFKVHTFNSSDTFEVTKIGSSPIASQVEYLVIAGGGGGGGGGQGNGGAGGAGGYRTDTDFAVTVQSYSITVGTGGAAGGNGSPGTIGIAGTDSIFDTITSAGGGGGGTFFEQQGTAGGSGGGAPHATGPGAAGNTPPTTPVQGFRGGSTSGSTAGGGGGGASEVGFAATTTDGGNGGDGLSSSIDGTPTFRGGGGGGGSGNGGSIQTTGGNGGGGRGANNTGADVSTAGTPNTGGGGGGGCDNVAVQDGSAGGSGVVIISYFSPASPVTQTIRTVEKSDLLPDVYNFIRFNGVHTQTLTIEGSSGNSLVMVANELAVQLEADPPLTTLHGQFTINPTNSGLPLNGGDPTSSVIDDPATNSMTLNSTITQADPATDAMVMWQEILDVNNSVSHSKMKIDGSIKNVRWF